jgi:hypothetical protein
MAMKMKENEEDKLKCSECNTVVKDEDTFCTNCGAVFKDGVACSVHNSSEADGFCVMCLKPFCKECGMLVNKIFFCDTHSQYEMYEGMARVFGCTDNLQAQHITSCLEQAGLHPFLYSRRFNPNADISPIINYRLYGNHPIVETKVLVPFREVLNAEEVLKELDSVS